MTTLELFAVAGFGLTLLGAIVRVIVVIASHKVDPDPHPGRYVDWDTHKACMVERGAETRATNTTLTAMQIHLAEIATTLKERLPEKPKP